MVQEFHVVRCFSCQTFQVQQVKKVNRWSCKLCGEKQSLLKEFGRGSGPDCRRHVQKLNAMRGAMMEEQEHNALLLRNQVETHTDDETEEQKDNKCCQVTHSQESCWSKYLCTPEEAESESEEDSEDVIDRQQQQCNVINRKRKWTDNWTSEQSHRSSLMKPISPTTRTIALSLDKTSAPSTTRTSAPSLNAGPVGKWANFLTSDRQVTEERKGPSASGWSQTSTLSCSNLDYEGPHSQMPRPPHPVSSMFQSGADFSLDEFDL